MYLLIYIYNIYIYVFVWWLHNPKPSKKKVKLITFLTSCPLSNCCCNCLCCRTALQPFPWSSSGRRRRWTCVGARAEDEKESLTELVHICAKQWILCYYGYSSTCSFPQMERWPTNRCCDCDAQKLFYPLICTFCHIPQSCFDPLAASFTLGWAQRSMVRTTVNKSIHGSSGSMVFFTKWFNHYYIVFMIGLPQRPASCS